MSTTALLERTGGRSQVLEEPHDVRHTLLAVPIRADPGHEAPVQLLSPPRVDIEPGAELRAEEQPDFVPGGGIQGRVIAGHEGSVEGGIVRHGGKIAQAKGKG